VKISSIVIAFCIFIIAWNSRRLLDNNYLLVIGIAYLFVGAIDLLDRIFKKFYKKNKDGSSVGEVPASHTGHCPEASREVI
jgi:UDP-N-acetylmuramyl pentapeptide phosphotransferase/UDP-N-acetylglucosamine-1-phosphate transferase